MRQKGQLFDLRRFRADHKVTQKELAERFSRPQSFLSAIEHGKRSAPVTLLDELAEAYKVDNISEYLSDPPSPTIGSVENVSNSLVNSPGSTMLFNESGRQLTREEVKQLLDMEVADAKQSEQQATTSVDTFADLVTMLKNAQERADKLEKENQALRAEIDTLKSLLPKRKK